MGQLVIDEETGEETEEFALYLCRRCAGDVGPIEPEMPSEAYLPLHSPAPGVRPDDEL